MTVVPETRVLLWRELPRATRDALAGRLDGLYGQASDACAFDALVVDKQQALLLLLRRLSRLRLWRGIRRVENIYGKGGVGMDFTARALFGSALRLRRDFVTLRARPAKSGARDFRERHTARAALHFLDKRLDKRGERRLLWSVHFDLYNPLASPVAAWLHLYRECWRAQTPDWSAIRDALGE